MTSNKMIIVIIETVNLLAHGLLCSLYRAFGIKMRIFHNWLKTASVFKVM